MEKNTFISSVKEGGDCYINYISPVSGKPKYHIGTLDFSKSTSPYINSKFHTYSRLNKVLDNNQVLTFCYDIDGFKPIDTSMVLGITPLNKIIKQETNGK